MVKYGWFLFAIFLVGCNSDPAFDDPGNAIQRGGVYVLNEGLWGQNNSFLQWVNPETGEMFGQTILGIWGFPIGDTGNFLSARNDTGVAVISTSNQLIFFRASTGKYLKQVAFDVPVEPREALSNGDGTWWVSSFKRHSVLNVDFQSGEILLEIPVGTFPEALLIHQGWLWVSCTGLGEGTTVHRISLQNFNNHQIFYVGLNPGRMIVTSTSVNVHILDDVWAEKPDSRIVTLDSNTGAIQETWRFSAEQIQAIDQFNGTELVVMTDQHLYRINPSNGFFQELQDFSTESSKGSIRYEMQFDQTQGIVWLTSLNSYTTRGWLEGWKNGIRMYGPFDMGINPGSLLWNY